jgi:anti-sigma factor RsiW
MPRSAIISKTGRSASRKLRSTRLICRERALSPNLISRAPSAWSFAGLCSAAAFRPATLAAGEQIAEATGPELTSSRLDTEHAAGGGVHGQVVGVGRPSVAEIDIWALDRVEPVLLAELVERPAALELDLPGPRLLLLVDLLVRLESEG